MIKTTKQLVLIASLAFLPLQLSAQSAQSSRGYTYPQLEQGEFSIVRDVVPTEYNRAHLDRTVDFESLPFSEAVIRVKGDGSRRVAVIVDPSCPHCRTLEDNLEKIDNLTIYTFIASILGGSTELVNAIHCSGDQSQKASAYDAYSKHLTPPTALACSSKTDERIKQSFYNYKSMDRVTPTIIFESNFFMPSVLEVDEIELLLEQSLTNKL